MPIDEINSQNFETIEQQPENPGQTGKSRKILYAAAGIFIFLVLVLLLALTQKQTASNGVPTPTSTPTPTPTPFMPTISSPSAYATDSAVLEIENDISSIVQQLQNVDLKENDILPPAINLNINFEQD